MATTKTKTPRKEAVSGGHEAPAVRRRVWLVGIGVGCALIIIFAAFLAWYFSGRSMMNVRVGDADVSQKTQPEIEQVIKQQESALGITFVEKGKATTVAAKDVGLTVDVKATLKRAMQARRTGNAWNNFQIWSTQTVPLVFVNDPGKLRLYIQQHFPSVFVDAKDAQIVFNSATNSYDIAPGTNGKGFDINVFEAALPNLALSPRNITLALATKPIEPIIQADKLVPVQKSANQAVSLPIQFSLNGRVVYQATPADIASWTHFVPDAVGRTAHIEYDRTAITNFVNQQVAPTFTTTPIDRKIVVNQATGQQIVIQAGRVGYQIKDVDKTVDAVMQALAKNQPLNQVISATEAPFKTVTMTGADKWIEVDLTHQRLTMYVGQAAIASYLISSGRAQTPTQTGTFAIYRKLPLTTMTGTILGEYYYVPNIKWVSYFDGGEAFHGTYWHHNFGHPMSHGCVNMTEADAKTLYDFAPIGTKVVVHY